MRTWKIMLLIVIAFVGCKKPYDPPAIASPASYLVVEGVINAGNDSTIIKLSRTVNLSSKVATNPLSGASISVISDQNSSYPLTETKAGTYMSPGLNLNNARTYRLNITTPDGKIYQSDFVTVLNSPPIDTIGYTVTKSDSSHGIQIFSGTHDPTNKAKYFRYDYQETWIFHSLYDSNYKSNGDTVLARDLVNDEIYKCWRSDTSSNIVLTSSAKLTQSVISNNPITFISYDSEKIGDEYSILVKQYALTSDAYKFWTNLKKNTEQLGSIFDALPSQINGNIHSITNPTEPVIGYISVGSVSTKRVFISTRELPAWLPALPNLNDDCIPVACLYSFVNSFGSPPVNQVDEEINYLKGGGKYALIPINAIVALGTGVVLGYQAADPICVDCTLRGTNKRPSFWVDK